jgi:hypothetical protein
MSLSRGPAEVVKAHKASDLLALLPELAGFQPRNSVVLLAFHGRRTCGAIRFDLPSSTKSAMQKSLALHMVGTLSKLTNAESAVVAIFADATREDSNKLPFVEYARLLGRRLDQAGFGVRELLYQGPAGWGSYYEPELPHGLHPLAEITGSPARANRAIQVLPIVGPAGERGSDREQPRVPNAEAEDVKRMQKELDRIERALDEFALVLDQDGIESPCIDEANVDPPLILEPLGDVIALAEAALAWRPDEFENHAAVLLFALQSPPIRDSVMLQWAFSSSVGRMSLSLGEVDPSKVGDLTAEQKRGRALCEKTLGDLMLGIGPRPNVDRLDAGIRLLRDFVSLVSGPERLAPLCMLAWLNWALGMGSSAGAYIDEARSIDPTYGMAELLDMMTRNGMLPEWAFNSSEAAAR